MKVKKRQTNPLTNKSLRNKVLIIFGVMFIIRLINQIPTPGVDTEYLKSFFEGQGSATGFLNLMTGGSLSSLSILALNITPYITTSIILELLSIVFPALEEIKKDGKHGQEKFKKITLYTSIGLSLFQAGAMAIGFGKKGMLKNYTWYWVVTVAVIWTLSAAALAFVGNLMTERKLCNGVSMILGCNILSEVLGDLMLLVENAYTGNTFAVCILHLSLWAVGIFLMTVFVVYLQSGRKELKITNSRLYNAKANPMALRSLLPIPVNASSVVPVIFASTIFSIPSLIGMFVTPKAGSFWQEFISYSNTGSWFQPGSMKYTIGWLVYAAMILFFTFFYTNIAFNENEIADNLKKSGSQIPGIRPGAETVRLLKKNIQYTTFWGGVGMTIVATVPMIVSGVFHIQNISLMGTSLVIIVGVIMENLRQLRSDTSQYRINGLM